MEQALTDERTERRSDIRREADHRIKLALEHEQLREVVVGRSGDNGLSSRVRILEGAMHRTERIRWMLAVAGVGVAGSVLTYWLTRGM